MSIQAYYTDGQIPTLSGRPHPSATECTIEYLNEGGANIVYNITVTNGRQPPELLENKLLRFRKDVRHVQPATEQLKTYEENFRDLFADENLITHELIHLDDGFTTLLNDSLRHRVRPSHRLQDCLPTDERYAMLVTNMMPELGETLIELKPKWLLQSPNAPANAKRCRTCALRAQRAAKNMRTATDDQECCPLTLVSSDASDRKRTAQNITDDKRIAAFLTTEAQDLLGTLKTFQKQLDPHGVLGVKGADSIYSLCRAMTLRDCTLYVRRSRNHIEARLGDLDFKQPEKLMSWRNTERSLADEGWYTNTESKQYLTKETVCLLSR